VCVCVVIMGVCECGDDGAARVSGDDGIAHVFLKKVLCEWDD